MTTLALNEISNLIPLSHSPSGESRAESALKKLSSPQRVAQQQQNSEIVAHVTEAREIAKSTEANFQSIKTDTHERHAMVIDSLLQTNIKFSTDGESKICYIEVTDEKTNELLRTIPSEAMRSVLAEIHENIESVLNENIENSNSGKLLEMSS